LFWLHGGGGCKKMFEYHAKKLSNHGWKSVLLDLPGHGRNMDKDLTK